MPTQPANKRWQAESDAYTLAEAERIQSNKNRVIAAKKMAKKMADDMEKTQREQVKSLRSIAANPIKRKAVSKKK